jgi:hypothetical protein
MDDGFAQPKLVHRHRGRLRAVFSFDNPTDNMKRPQKITLGEMRAMGIRGLLVYCSDFKCSHNVAISGDRWPDHVRLSDLEPLFTCQACGLKGAEVVAPLALQDALKPKLRCREVLLCCLIVDVQNIPSANSAFG